MRQVKSIIGKSYQQGIAGVAEKSDICTEMTETRHLVNAYLAYGYTTINSYYTMKYEISITHPNITASFEIESHPGFIIGSGNIILNFPEDHSHAKKDFIWFSTASMEHDIREALVIFKGRDADIECRMKKPWITEAGETESKIQETLFGLLSHGLIQKTN